jgi:hypothetical protein
MSETVDVGLLGGGLLFEAILKLNIDEVEKCV